MYLMLSWIPTLFVDAGYTRAQGIEALTGFNLGAIPGILVLAFLTTRLPLAPLLSVFFLSAGGVLAYVGLTEPTALGSLTTLMFIGGVFLHGGFTCWRRLGCWAGKNRSHRVALVGGGPHFCWLGYVQPVSELRLAAGYRRPASVGVCR